MKTKTIGAALAALSLLLLPGCALPVPGGVPGAMALLGGSLGGAAGPKIPGLFGRDEMTPEQLDAAMDEIETRLRQQKRDAIKELADDMVTGKLFADGVAGLLGEPPGGAEAGLGLESASPPARADPFRALRTHLGEISPSAGPEASSSRRE